MLQLDIGATEGFDEKTQEFVTLPGMIIDIEHSLLSVSKWESVYEKPFLSADSTMTFEETVKYVELMTLTPDVPPEVYAKITGREIQQVNEYIQAKMTATWFSDRPGPSTQSREVITSEIIYYWLIALNIPFDPVQGWHLNRLFALVKVCNEKNKPQNTKKNFTRGDLDARRQLNAQRKAKMNTQG